MQPSEFIQYPQGPREKNQATSIIEALLQQLIHPKAQTKVHFDALLQEWILDLDIAGKMQTFNLNLLLLHANLSHLVLSNRCIKKLSKRYVHYTTIDEEAKKQPQNLTRWPGVFKCLPSDLRKVMRLHTSHFGKIANQFSRGEYLVEHPAYSPLMIFVTTCLTNIALSRIPTFPVDTKRNKYCRTHSYDVAWRYEFNLDKNELNLLQQQQCRRQTFSLTHTLSTSLQWSKNCNVYIENLPSHSTHLNRISYYNDEMEVLFPAGLQLQFKRGRPGFFTGRIINTPELDRDYYYTSIALRYTYQNFLSKKYKDEDETIQIGADSIARPNHGLAHNTLVIVYFSWVKNIIREFSNNYLHRVVCELLPNPVQEKLNIVLLFLVTGRESEASFFQNAPDYIAFKNASRKNFLEFAAISPLFNEKIGPYDLSVKEYADLILYFSDENHLDQLHNQDSEFILYCRMISFAHDLHLARCYKQEDYQNTLTRHWPHLSIPPSHPTIKALNKAVIASMTRMGDLVYGEGRYRQPFNIYSTNMRKCDELLQSAPLRVPLAAELDNFLDHIQTEKAIKHELLPNLVARLDWGQQIAFLKSIPKDDWLEIFKMPCFFNNPNGIVEQIKVISELHPTLLPTIIKHPRVNAVLRDTDSMLVVLRRTPALEPFIFPLLNIEELRAKKSNLISILTLAPSLQKKLLIELDMAQLFFQVPIETYELRLIANTGVIPTLLQNSDFCLYLRKNHSIFQTYLSAEPEAILCSLAWNSLIREYYELAIVLENDISSHSLLLTDPDKIALIDSVGRIQDVLAKTFAYTSFLSIPEIKIQISTASDFATVMERASADICLHIAIEYHYVRFIKKITDWFALYISLPAIREHLLAHCDPFQLVTSDDDYFSLARTVPTLTEKILQNEMLISRIFTWPKLQKILESTMENTHWDLTHWLNYPNINALLTCDQFIILFLHCSPTSFNWFKEHNNFPNNCSPNVFLKLMNLFPEKILEFLEMPILTNRIILHSEFTAIIQFLAQRSPYIVGSIALLISTLLKNDNQRIKQLITKESLQQILLHESEYFKQVLVSVNQQELLRQCLTDHQLLLEIIIKPELICDLWPYFSESILDQINFTRHLMIFFAVPDLCLNWAIKHYLTTRTALLLLNNEAMAFNLLPYLLLHPDIFILQSANNKTHLSWLLPEHIITEEYNQLNKQRVLLANEFARFFCFSRTAQVALLPELYRIQDLQWRSRMLESVPEQDREWVKRHFGQFHLESIEPNKYQVFFDKRKKIIPIDTKSNHLQEYRKSWNEISSYITQLENNTAVEPTRQQLQIIKKNVVFIGLVLSCTTVDADTLDELILSLNQLCKQSELIMQFWQAFPGALQNSLGRHYPSRPKLALSLEKQLSVDFHQDPQQQTYNHMAI